MIGAAAFYFGAEVRGCRQHCTTREMMGECCAPMMHSVRLICGRKHCFVVMPAPSVTTVRWGGRGIGKGASLSDLPATVPPFPPWGRYPAPGMARLHRRRELGSGQRVWGSLVRPFLTCPSDDKPYRFTKPCRSAVLCRARMGGVDATCVRCFVARPSVPRRSDLCLGFFLLPYRTGAALRGVAPMLAPALCWAAVLPPLLLRVVLGCRSRW